MGLPHLLMCDETVFSALPSINVRLATHMQKYMCDLGHVDHHC